jgi:hypothetical protein
MTSSQFNPTHKDDFSAVYDLPNPRLYYRGLEPTNYRMPGVVASFVLRITDSISRLRDIAGPAKVLDFACGYGAVGALMRHQLTMADLYDYYGRTADDGAPSIENDQHFFAASRRPNDSMNLCGIDIAGTAVEYAKSMGFIDEGYCENLATSSPSDALRDSLAGVDLVIESGSLAVVLPQVFAQIATQGRSPWILYCPRPDNDWAELEKTWRSVGYEAQSCSVNPVAYRRPLGSVEHEEILQLARSHGRPAEQSIDGGFIRVPLMLARPIDESRTHPASVLSAAHQDVFLDPIPE